MKRIFLFILALAMFSFAKTNHNTPGNKVLIERAEGVSIGDKAPYFKLKNIDGKEYSFDNIMDTNGQKPKGFIVVFTCNTCPYAKANEQRLIDLHNDFGPKGYPVVAIQPNDPALSPGDSVDKMKKNAEEKGFPFLYLFDDGQQVFPKYGATKTPEVYLVDADLIVRYHGAIDDNVRDGGNVTEKFVELAIQAIDSGIDPATKTTKAIGCSIKST